MKTQTKTEALFPIAGIGASAGGLEALQELFKELAPNTGMAFVVIQHLDPTHPSHCAEILSRTASMPVTEIRDGTAVKPDHVYVIPSNASVTVSEGVLIMQSPREQPPHPMVIDTYLKSLATDRKNLAIGVILSGTGSDGARGLSEIRAEGGITFAQDETARFGGMPQAAIGMGCVDFVLAPAGIARELNSISGNHGAKQLGTQHAMEPAKDILDVLELVRQTSGISFPGYKQSSIRRRISRRMLLQRTDNLPDYLAYLRKNPSEVNSLAQDLLIKVTHFFRDQGPFETLKTDIFPRMLIGRSHDSTIRVWVPACATGEEVYSFAICFLELIQDGKLNYRIQIFGTDISEQAVEKARHGIYSEGAMAEVSPERRKRFFIGVNGAFQINKNVREMCIFARHNVIEDPPFSGLDLISCRNLLIYLDSEAQKDVLSLFHYALKLNGFLFLGKSEGVGTVSELFAPANADHRIFSKKLVSGRAHFRFAREVGTPWKPFTKNLSKTDRGNPVFDLAREADRAIATRFAPNGVIVNEEMELLQIRGHTGNYLEPSPGEMSKNLLKMARPGLLPGLRALMHHAKHDSACSKENVTVRLSGASFPITLDAIPLTVPGSNERYFIFSFLEAATKSAPVGRRPTGSFAKSKIDEELAETKKYLQAIIVREQAANEELKTANEESQSSNEELQSTNEELETAKEELQSINEELSTLNAELQDRNHQLHLANNDLNNLVTSVRTPVLMLDHDLRIRWFSAGVEKLMRLIPGDIGRSIADIKINADLPDLVQLITRSIEKNSIEERELQDAQGHWWSMWIRPYQTTDGKIDGAVITLFDIDALRRARDYADAIIKTIRECLVVLDGNLRIKSANRSFYDFFGTSQEEIEGQPFYSIGAERWDIPALRNLLERTLSEKTSIDNYEVSHPVSGKGMRTMILNARAMKNRMGNEEEALILLAIDDITERKQVETALRRTTQELITLNTDLEQFAYIASHDLQEPIRMVSTYMELLAKKYKGELDADANEFIEIAVKSAARMKVLVEDLLTLSKTGREKLKYEPVNCSALVDQVIATFEPLIQEAFVEIVRGPLPNILTNPVLLGQVFQNLIGNAIKFRSHAVPKIRIGAKETQQEWEFSVSDNGIGIDKEYMERIFDIFQRLHGQELYKGTGIGLAICKKIVGRYGGRIWVDSETGKGSTFHFTISKNAGPTGAGNDQKGGG